MKKLFMAVIGVCLILSMSYAQMTGGPMGGSGGGVIVSPDCSAYTAIGQLCQDSDDAKLYKGTGAGVLEIAAGGSGDMTKAAYDTNANDAADKADSVKSPATTGVVTITGPGAGTTRVKTVRDANDTVLELGGSYSPTGTWTWTGATWSGTPTLNQNTTGSAGSVKSPATTGVSQFTGPAAGTTRAKTVRDANDTVLELGGDYTPTGTWNWGSATVTWPTFNQNTSGTAANVSGTPALPNGTTATTQSAADNSTKLATTAYVDTGIGALSSVYAPISVIGDMEKTTYDSNADGKVDMTAQNPPALQSVTCTDSGDGNPGTLTVTPSAGPDRVDIAITVMDADGCTITMAETSAVAGTIVVVTNISAANTASFATQAGILSLIQGPMTMGAGESLSLIYKDNRWLEIGRSSGTWEGVIFGGFTASAGMVPLTDASGNLANSYLAFTGPDTSLKTKTLSNATATVVEYDQAGTGAIDTTGQITGKVKVLSISSSCTIGSDCDSTSVKVAYGGIILATAAVTITLPEIADSPSATQVGVGASICVIARDASEALVVDPHANDSISLCNSGACAKDTAGDSITATQAGAKICLVAVENDNWMDMGTRGTWTAN